MYQKGAIKQPNLFGPITSESMSYSNYSIFESMAGTL
jgi:hypothetical protein